MTAAKQPRILIVDGDPDAGAELVRALEGFGHRAIWACDTGRAIEELRGARADLVFIAAVPATIGGIGALTRYADFLDIPVVLMGTMAEAPERPRYPYLCKPFRPADMRTLIGEELRGDFVTTRDPRHRPPAAMNASPGRSETAASGGTHGRS
jgi:DNA-binding NtrC family response regulator